jgi:hypothetical protein
MARELGLDINLIADQVRLEENYQRRRKAPASSNASQIRAKLGADG